MNLQLRRTILAPRHEAAGATCTAFGDWWLPLHFAGTLAEHHAVRERAGVFDVSHLGTVRISGPGALEVIGRALTNDPTRLEVGTTQYTLCCDEHGGIVDDLIVARVAPEQVLAVPNAANTAAVVAALEQARADQHGAGFLDVEVVDETDRWAILAVQGPDALAEIDRVVLGIDPDDDLLGARELPYLGVVGLALDDEVAYLSRTGYTGEPGAELLVPAAVADDLWDRLLDAGVPPCGLGARDTLRLEMGYPLHGQDLSTDVDPYTARLGWAVALDRGEFHGREALVAIRAAGPRQRLWGLRGTDRRPLRAGMTVLGDVGSVGRVTSGGFSPTAGLGIGLALLDAGLGPGDRLAVDVRGRSVDVEVVRPPFVDRDPRG